MILAAWYHPILATLFGFVAVMLMIVILLQRGKGVGLSGAFGGAGGHTAFGAKTGDVLTWATIVIAALLLTFAVTLNYVFVPLKPFAGTAAPPSSAAPGAPATAPAPGAQAPAPVRQLPGQGGTAPARQGVPLPGPGAQPPAKGAPASPAKEPPSGLNSGDTSTWPKYASHPIFGDHLG
jgi:preprotein translocase subunit SecG